MYRYDIIVIDDNGYRITIDSNMDSKIFPFALKVLDNKPIKNINFIDDNMIIGVNNLQSFSAYYLIKVIGIIKVISGLQPTYKRSK